MNIRASFNKIHIVEATSETDLATGKALYENTLAYKLFEVDGLNCELSQPKSVSSFIGVLENINAEAANGVFPIVHIEAHGSREGLRVGSGEFIKWDTIRKSLTDINVSCRNNLLVTMAACEGVYLFKIVKPVQRAPFWGLIGPKNTMKARQLEVDYSSFYSELLETFDGN